MHRTSTGKPELAELPDLNAAFTAEVLKQSRQPFGGDPSAPLDEDAPEPEDEDAEVCSEKHRLSYVVRVRLHTSPHCCC